MIELVDHSVHLVGPKRTPISEYKVAAVQPHAQYPESVRIFFVEAGKDRRSRKHVSACDGDTYYTIEDAGQVVYDSRARVPVDMAAFEASAAEFRRWGR